MTDIAEQLLAAIAEREKAALAAERGTGSTWGSRDGMVLDEDGLPLVRTARATEVFVQHMSIWDPKAVYRLCQAHREIVEYWQATKAALEAAEGTILAGACRVRLGAYENVLEALVRAYTHDQSPGIESPREGE